MIIHDSGLLSDTPFVAVDLDAMENNIRRMAELSSKAGVKLRPHTKTHKSPYIAELQLAAGAAGITCAKLGEAEVMADSGIDDILVAYPLVGRQKLERLGKLMDRARVTVAFDDLEVAKGINEIGRQRRKRIPAYIDVDTGLRRMGRPPEESVKHILEIAKLPYIEVKGVMSHTGQAYAKDDQSEVLEIAIKDAELLHETKLGLEKAGIFIEEISIGATATARFVESIPYATEMRPGMYVFNDRFVMGAGGASESDCAARVFATVVARPSKDRLIIDAGSKTLAQDAYKHGGHGRICGHPNLTIRALSEEHGTIAVDGESDVRIGDVLEIIPNHICPVVNLADQLYGFRDGRLERIIPVLGRGKNR